MAFTAFPGFMRCLTCSLFVAFREFVAFMGHWGWTYVAFTELVVFMGHWVGRLGRFFTAFGAFMGRWHCKFGTWVLFSLCMFFMLSIGGCLRVWRFGAPASPSHEPLLSELGIQLRGPFGLAWGLMAGGHGFASHGGTTLCRGWLCQRWKPLDILGTHLH